MTTALKILISHTASV